MCINAAVTEDRETDIALGRPPVAAIEDPRFGIKGMPSVLSDEVRDSIEMLRAELDEIGLLEPYRREGGTLGVW